MNKQATSKTKGKAPAGGLPTYTAAEVATHNKEDDMWTILNWKVFNVTDYAKKHPGGAKIICAYAGKDMTSDYGIFLRIIYR